MKMIALCLGLFGCLAMFGCSHAVSPYSQQAADVWSSVVEKEVTAVIHSYMAGYTAARCDDVTPISRHVRDRMMYATATKVVWVPLAETEQEMRDLVCGWVSHSGTVDSVTVDVLSPDVAVAGWLYHDEVKLKSGEIKRYKGSALMTLVRSVDGWKIAATMAAYE